ncbi:MAG: hypothetical protein RLZZ341_2226, partial [Pseudomonadota bacterium]
MAARHGLGPRRIGQPGAAVEQPLQVGARAAGGFGLGRRRGRDGRRIGQPPQPDQRLAFVDRLAHRRVDGQHRHWPPLHGAGAADQAVGRRVAFQVVQAAAAALRRHGQG